MSTPISLPQENTTFNSEPVYQDWAPIPAITEFTFFLDGGLLLPVLVDFKIKDVIDLPANSIYSEFQLRTNRNFVDMRYSSWLNITSDFDFINVTPFPLTTNGVVRGAYLSINIGLLPPGEYQANLIFSIYGKNSVGEWVPVPGASHVHIVVLRIYRERTITFSPSSINITHYVNTPSPVVPVQMNGNLWTIEGPDKYILSSDDPDVEITSETIGSQLIYKASGSGSRIVNLSLSNIFNTSEGSLYVFSMLKILAGISTWVDSILINVNLENENTFAVVPSELNFTAVKEIIEPESQYVLVHSVEDYVVSHSPWLIVERGLGGVLNLPGLIVIPIATANMDGGVYNGQIVLMSTINGQISTIVIPVTYNLQDYIDIPYRASDFNFTLDGTFLHFNTLNENTYFDFLLKGIFTEFYSDISKELNVALKIPLLKGRQNFNIGEGIHRLMRRVQDLQLNNSNQYKLAKIGFEIQERVHRTGELIRETITDYNYNFIAGFKPKMIGNFALLLINPKPTRVYSFSIQYLNILMPPGIATLIFLKNGVEFSQETITTAENIYCAKIDFSILEAIPGDNIEVRLIVGMDFISKNYIVFPEGLEKNVIIWEDDFLLKSVLDFSGKYEIKSDTEIKSQTLYKKLSEALVSIDSKKTSKLNINTGFLMESDIISVENLMSSKRAWIKLSDGALLDLVPTGKTLVENDSDRELISFDVEFQINRKYNEKIYTF